MGKDYRRAGFLYLPKPEDLLRLVKAWMSQTGVNQAQLAKVIRVDKSAVARIFSGQRGLHYDEAARIVDYLMRRLSPLPNRTIDSISHPGRLVRVFVHETVAAAAEKLIDGKFSQVPLYDGDRYLGLVTDRMILERMLHPNISDFKGNWISRLRRMRIDEADITEGSAIYRFSSSISSVADALTHFYAVVLGQEEAPSGIVTRWDYLKLLKGQQRRPTG